MTTDQLFYRLGGLIVAAALTTSGILATAFKLYLDAKFDPLKNQVDLLVQYMISHEGRISVLEDRTKPK